jgi:hypothetical protein
MVDLVRPNRDEEDLDRAELAVLDAVDALWQRAAEDERELICRRPLGVTLGDLDQFDLEGRLCRGGNQEAVSLMPPKSAAVKRSSFRGSLPPEADLSAQLGFDMLVARGRTTGAPLLRKR